MQKIFSLTSTNLTHLGGPMGTEYTTTNFIKYFTTVQLAKNYAEADFKWQNKRVGNKKFPKIKWYKFNLETDTTNVDKWEEYVNFLGLKMNDRLYKKIKINRKVNTLAKYSKAIPIDCKECAEVWEKYTPVLNISPKPEGFL